MAQSVLESSVELRGFFNAPTVEIQDPRVRRRLHDVIAVEGRARDITATSAVGIGLDDEELGNILAHHERPIGHESDKTNRSVCLQTFGGRGVLCQASEVRMDCCHARSEEHTSELQSLRHLVCRLLLEKK